MNGKGGKIALRLNYFGSSGLVLSGKTTPM
jgi:hypothetical protein